MFNRSFFPCRTCVHCEETTDTRFATLKLSDIYIFMQSNDYLSIVDQTKQHYVVNVLNQQKKNEDMINSQMFKYENNDPFVMYD